MHAWNAMPRAWRKALRLPPLPSALGSFLGSFLGPLLGPFLRPLASAAAIAACGGVGPALAAPSHATAAFGSGAHESDEMDYDAIVSELNQQEQRTKAAAGRTRSRFAPAHSSSLDDVMIHAGVGVSNMFGALSFADGGRIFLNQRGVQASLGIDLLSSEWIAEGSARTFTDSEYARNGVSAKEFDLKLLYKPRLSASTAARFGGGLAARYMTIDRGTLGVVETQTPASVGVLGLDVFASPTFSFGAEASIRSALISDSVDQLSYDASIRVDAHF